MAQWKSTDGSANSVVWAASSLGIGSGKASQTSNNAAMFGNTTPGAFLPNKAVGQFGVSTVEASASEAAHAGWVLRTEGTGNRAGRVQIEVLVAGGMVAGDADADVIPNYKLSFVRQPIDVSTNTSTPVSISSQAKSKPEGAVLAYQWQANTGAGFASITDGVVYSNTATSVLYIAAPTGLNNAQFRVVVSAANAASITSKTSILTVA